MEGMAEATAVPPAPLQELVLTLEHATHMAKQLPATTNPTHLLQIYTSTGPHLTPASSLQGHGNVDSSKANGAGGEDGDEDSEVLTKLWLLRGSVVGVLSKSEELVILYTWKNGRDEEAFMEERLDRVCATVTWSELHPRAKVFHLTTTYSDHDPILLDTTPIFAPTPRHRHKLHRFKEKWASHPECEQVI
ncbi:hypothetical protein SO802_007605 [Lithocarpus litseifolius]|uniref:Uncharacterized protein n=1 Tax=Lithocarpus litseifolius TaxID=425828 RepID=A0AAW2DRP2_9ROSI